MSESKVWSDRRGHLCSFRPDGTISVVSVNNQPTRTIQSEIDACDINKIVAKFGMKNKPIKAIANNLLMTSHVRRDEGKYGDFTGITDYASAVIQLREASETFMQLPSSIRKRFGNDPGNLIEFLGDENNRSEAIELGLIDNPNLNPGSKTIPASKLDKDGNVVSASEGKSD